MVSVLTYWDSAAFAMFSWYTELMPDIVYATAQEEVRMKQYQNRKNSVKGEKSIEEYPLNAPTFVIRFAWCIAQLGRRFQGNVTVIM